MDDSFVSFFDSNFNAPILGLLLEYLALCVVILARWNRSSLGILVLVHQTRDDVVSCDAFFVGVAARGGKKVPHNILP